MNDHIAVPDRTATLAETVAPAAFLLGAVPVLTTLVMTAVRYVADGTI